MHTDRNMEDVSREVQVFLGEGKVPAPLNKKEEEAARRIGLHLEGSGSLWSMTLPPQWKIDLETVVQVSTVIGIIYDELGRRRAEFQYRDLDSCNTRVFCRFGIEYVQGHPAVVDRAINTVYFYIDESDGDTTRARSWLTHRHPHWEDPAAYWYDGPAHTL